MSIRGINNSFRPQTLPQHRPINFQQQNRIGALGHVGHNMFSNGVGHHVQNIQADSRLANPAPFGKQAGIAQAASQKGFIAKLETLLKKGKEILNAMKGMMKKLKSVPGNIKQNVQSLKDNFKQGNIPGGIGNLQNIADNVGKGVAGIKGIADKFLKGTKVGDFLSKILGKVGQGVEFGKDLLKKAAPIGGAIGDVIGAFKSKGSTSSKISNIANAVGKVADFIPGLGGIGKAVSGIGNFISKLF